jgi:hypothetical protein
MVPFWKKLNLGFISSTGRNDGFVALDIGSSSIKLVETVFERNGSPRQSRMLPVPRDRFSKT